MNDRALVPDPDPALEWPRPAQQAPQWPTAHQRGRIILMLEIIRRYYTHHVRAA